MPLLVVLLVGMVTGGIAYNQKLQITHAAREGARFAATVSPTQTFTNGGTWAENMRDLVVERSAGDLTASQVCVSLVKGSTGDALQPLTVYNSSSNYSTSGVVPCISPQTYPLSGTDSGLRVQVTVQRPGSIETIFFPDVEFTMTSSATAKSESGA
jgi:Flp pilus assembly protein TadG